MAKLFCAFWLVSERYHWHYGLLLTTYARAEPDVRSNEFPLGTVLWNTYQPRTFGLYGNIKFHPWRVDTSISFSIIKYLLTSNVRSLRGYQTSALTRCHLYLFLYNKLLINLGRSVFTGNIKLHPWSVDTSISFSIIKYLLTSNVRSLQECQTSSLTRCHLYLFLYNKILINLERSVFTGISNFSLDTLSPLSLSL